MQESEPQDVLLLANATLQEVVLSTGPAAHGVRRHSRGFALRSGRKELAAAGGDGQDSPRGVADVQQLGSNPDLQRLRNPELVLAAEDAEQHAAWMSEPTP